MSKDPFEEARKEFDRAREEHRLDMERARQAMSDAVAQARAEMDAARVEFMKAIEEARRHIEAARERMQGEMYRRASGQEPRRRKPRRRRPGGEPAPVMPRPNPSPLQDGAEAPIE